MGDLIPAYVTLIRAEVDRILPEENQVALTNGYLLPYDQLVIATGTTPRPEETPGLIESGWRRTTHDFYTLDGAVAL